MITVDEVESLDEAQCKAILDFFAKRAYGENTKISEVQNEDDSSTFFITMDGKYKFNIIFFDEQQHSIKDFTGIGTSFKDLLSNIAKIFNTRAASFVGYLPHTEHLIDKTSSIEEALISLDVQNVYV